MILAGLTYKGRQIDVIDLQNPSTAICFLPNNNEYYTIYALQKIKEERSDYIFTLQDGLEVKAAELGEIFDRINYLKQMLT